MTKQTERWIIALTGGSGMPYALRLIELLSAKLSEQLSYKGELHIVVSASALRVLHAEHDIKISSSNLNSRSLLGKDLSNLIFHHYADIAAPIASGSFVVKGMIICPCSMSTLAHLAHGVGTNLIHRAADVVIKEGRKLVLVARETPLSSIHLENMLKLSRLGVTILPAMPGFYQRPSSIAELVDALVMKILDSIGIDSTLLPRWGEKELNQRSAMLINESSTAKTLKMNKHESES